MNEKTEQTIDPFKVNAAILPGVQNYWGERAVSHKLQCKWLTCADGFCEDVSLRKLLLGETILLCKASYSFVVCLTLAQVKDQF